MRAASKGSKASNDPTDRPYTNNNFTKLIGCKYMQLIGFANLFFTQCAQVAFLPGPKLFFVVSDVDPFAAKPVLDLVVATYDHEAVIAVFVDEAVV